MAGSTNFLVWDEALANTKTDGDYDADTMRSGGAPSSAPGGAVFPSDLANKLFHQCSMMPAALAQVMANRGYTVSDAVFNDLVAILSALISVDQVSVNLAAKGHISFMGLVVNWGYQALLAEHEAAVTFDMPFPTAFLAGWATCKYTNPIHTTSATCAANIANPTNTGMVVIADQYSTITPVPLDGVYWFALGH